MTAHSPLPETQRDIMLALPERRIPMPRSQQALFGLLTYLAPNRSIGDLIGMLDFSGIAPIDIFLAVLGRAPDDPAMAVPEADFDAPAQFRAALTSGEFRRGIMRNLLSTFRAMGRDIFIHVPKCAGTDLIFNLATRGLPLPRMLELEGWLSEEEFLATVGGICRQLPFHERFFVYGHMELGSYVGDAGIRAGDRIFTVIRDPLGQMLSQANYAIGRLRQDPLGTAPDTAEILQYLEIPRLPADIGDRELKELASRALMHPEITQPNRACIYLGRGMRGTYASAIDRLVVHDVEITTTALYERWLQERWNIGSSARHNRSEAILTRGDLPWLYAGALRDRVAEDQKLFDMVSWALEQTGGASVTGVQLARLAGASLMTGVPPKTAAPQAPAPEEPQADQGVDRDLLALDDPDLIERYLDPAPQAAPGAPWMELVTSIAFGVGGEGAGYQLDGWSVTERTFTWTNAPVSRLSLPALPDADLCVLRIVGSPFVSEEKLPAQRVEVWAGDKRLGVARLTRISVIECEFPAGLLPPNEPVALSLRLPDAARPRDINGFDDERLLGFALHKIVLYQVHGR